jgi:hypothetical protein
MKLTITRIDRKCISALGALSLMVFLTQATAQAIPTMTLKPQLKSTVCGTHVHSAMQPTVKLDVCVTAISSFEADVFELKVNDTSIIKKEDTEAIKGVFGRHQNMAFGFKCEETFDAQGAMFDKLSASEVSAKFKEISNALEQFKLAELIRLSSTSREVIWTCKTELNGKNVLSTLVVFEQGR